jgi:hypothetical protein
MREIIEAGTDVAGLAIGDPSLLGALRGCKNLRDCREELSKAMASGTLWRTDTGADGDYLIHLFIEEEPPASIRGFFKEPIAIERFRVPSGRLLVAGEECFVGEISPHEFPQWGREIEVAAGEYKFTAYLVEPPTDVVKAQFDVQASRDQRRAWALGNNLPFICVLMTVAALVVGYFVYLRTVSPSLSLSPLLVAVIAWWWQARFRGRASYRAAEKLFRAIARELPSVAVVMRRLA